MKKIEKNSPLHVQVYKVLRKKIIDGVFCPGEPVIEASLAENLGVSRSPIREAIRLLEQDGLIKKEGNHKIIRKFTSKDIEDVYKCRLAIEALAAILAVKNITARQLAHLNEIFEMAKKVSFVNDQKNVLKYNTMFHETIVQASKNQTLIDLYASLSGLFMYYTNARLVHFHQNDDYLIEHQKIIYSLESGKEEIAEACMKGHIESELNRFLNFLS
ncbi:GntR family transcriptional regulator [Robertmurraya sp. FSL R5-0851]|uniref:GntR family transcriptional regulator n=1 Tax=Robertmurraya sp. FSL R5-0851 TaxID=2921584 RepID=UPI0030FC93F2